MRVVLGVSGGIAAYKAALLLRLFTERGDDVTVVPTRAALNFVGAPTWSALSGKPVSGDVFDDVDQVRHVRLGQHADLVVVAPATADLLAKAATGQAPDLLTNTLLTAACPVVFAPAMHTEMWQHPATVANVSTLRARGAHVLDPASGRLTGADSGPGRLPEPEDILAFCDEVVASPRSGGAGSGDLAGLRVTVTAGGTREPMDPVRYLGNRSSGKQGYALAAEAAARGAAVTLISTSSLPTPPGCTLVPVETAAQLQNAVREHVGDVLVMAAAVADFRASEVATTKIKKSFEAGHEDDAPVIRLERNPDILATAVSERGSARRPVIVGFAAETGDASGSVLDHARAKLARKGCDLLVANEVGDGVTFGQDRSTVHILRRVDGMSKDAETTVGPADKRVIAAAVWDAIRTLTTDQ